MTIMNNMKEVAHNMLVPMVIERSGGNERSFDIYSRLLKERIIFIGGAIDDHLANLIIAQLLYLESESSEKTINVYINSPGGAVTAGLAIYDTLQYLHNPIQTICMGQAVSMGAFLLAAGATGLRKALPSSRVMLHQPWGGVEGQASDIHLQTKEMLRIKHQITKYLAHHTGKDTKIISKDIERDYYMSAQQALEYGIIDEIVHNNKTTQKEK